jgi:hypothetical protein
MRLEKGVAEGSGRHFVDNGSPAIHDVNVLIRKVTGENDVVDGRVGTDGKAIVVIERPPGTPARCLCTNRSVRKPRGIATSGIQLPGGGAMAQAANERVWSSRANGDYGSWRLRQAAQNVEETGRRQDDVRVDLEEDVRRSPRHESVPRLLR